MTDQDNEKMKSDELIFRNLLEEAKQTQQEMKSIYKAFKKIFDDIEQGGKDESGKRAKKI